MSERNPEPEGLVYQPDFITEAEQGRALGVLESMEFGPSPWQHSIPPTRALRYSITFPTRKRRSQS